MVTCRVQSLLCKRSLALLLLLEDFNRGLGGVHGLQVQEGQGGEAGEVLGCIGVVVDMGVDDTCVLSPPGQEEGFSVVGVTGVLPSTGQASKLCVIRVLSATSL